MEINQTNLTNKPEKKISKLALASFIFMITGFVFLFIIPMAIFKLFDFEPNITFIIGFILLLFSFFLGVISIFYINKKTGLKGKWLAQGSIISILFLLFLFSTASTGIRTFYKTLLLLSLLLVVLLVTIAILYIRKSKKDKTELKQKWIDYCFLIIVILFLGFIITGTIILTSEGVNSLNSRKNGYIKAEISQLRVMAELYSYNKVNNDSYTNLFAKENNEYIDNDIRKIAENITEKGSELIGFSNNNNYCVSVKLFGSKDLFYCLDSRGNIGEYSGNPCIPESLSCEKF